MLNKYFSVNNLIKKSQADGDENNPINQQKPMQPAVPQVPAQAPVNQAPANPPANQPPAQPPVQPPNQLAQKPKGDRVLVFLGDKKWTAYRSSASIKLKGLTPQEYAKLAKIAEAHMRTLSVGGKYPNWILDKEKRPQSYFLFSKNNEINEGYYVITSDPIGFAKLTKGFEDLGFDTTLLTASIAPAQQEGQVPQGNQPLQDPATVEATNPDGDVVSIRFTYNQEVIDFIRKEKIVQHPNVAKPVSSCIFSIRAGNVPSQLVDLANFMKMRDYNVEQFRLAIEKFEAYFDENKVSKVDKNKVVMVEKAVSPGMDKNGNRVMQETKFLLKIIYPNTPESLNEMRNFIKFSFPSKGNNTDLDPREYREVDDRGIDGMPNGKKRSYFVEQEAGAPVNKFPPQGMRLEVDGGKACFIYGEYDDLVRFGVLLTTRNWDVSQYRTAVSTLSNGKKDAQGNVIDPPRVKKTRYTGEPDGYKKLGPDGRPLLDENGKIIPDTERFFSETIDQIARSENDPEKPIIDLFYKQKQGIFWLYQRNSAILGDATGTGKTLSTLAAAAMRMKQNPGSRTIIFTPKATQNQWVAEIQKLIRNTIGKVSTNPASGADWIVMSYSNLASKPELNADGTVKINANGAPIILSAKGKRVQMALDALATQNFTVCIFDEAHSLKREDSATARNIEVVTKKIPFKWGATATPASNSAIDVHNILKCSGHSLGKLSKEDFKEEFIGENASMKTLADKQKALVMIQKAHNLNKWLCLSGAYLKRSMNSMNPGMPAHEINEQYIEDIKFNMDAFNRGLEEKLQEYGRTRRSVLVQLMAERMTLANQKVPHTIREAVNILNQGGKVLIFSCFKNSCEALFNSMQSYLRGGLQGYEGEDHTNIAAAGYKVVQITDKSKGSKGVQQAVDGFKGVIRERNGKLREDPDSLVKVMIVSALKGGTGISLENTTEHVLINDFDWMPAVCEQVEGRAYRINNIFPVNTRYMIVRGSGVDANGKRVISPDEKFYEYVRTKMEITKAIQHIDEKMEEQLAGGKSVKEQEAELLKKQIDLVNNEANIEQYIDDLGGGNLEEEKGKRKQGVGDVLDDLFEEEQARKEDENEDGPDVRMAGVTRWYKSAFGFL